LKKYDYIFTGAGCAGLSLLTRMINAGLIAGKNVLLIDRAPKQKNDRTWCFWEQSPGFFEPIICKQWNELWFYSNSFSKLLSVAPYYYKMIRGIDFYTHCFNSIQQQSGIDILYGEITDLNFFENSLSLNIDGKSFIFSGAVIFNSIQKEESASQQKSVYLLQHFKGWMIETIKPFFKINEAILMDFRVAQTNGTTFVYVLPLSENKALVEYTLFSKKTLPNNIYNEGLEQYLQQFLQLTQYTILEEEFGIIPMTNAKFPWFANGMYNIGTAGGQTKASSGYTFQFIQKQSDAIIEQIKNNTLNPHIKPAAVPKRFNFYDAVLLRVLDHQYAAGSEVFTNLFKKNRSQSIFSFLDNESSIATEFSIIKSLPKLPFLKGAYKQIVSR
jgi:lycopene beta-cyclase